MSLPPLKCQPGVVSSIPAGPTDEVNYHLSFDFTPGSGIDVVLIPRLGTHSWAQHQVYLCLNTSDWSLTWNSSINKISAWSALPKSLSHSLIRTLLSLRLRACLILIILLEVGILSLNPWLRALVAGWQISPHVHGLSILAFSSVCALVASNVCWLPPMLTSYLVIFPNHILQILCYPYPLLLPSIAYYWFHAQVVVVWLVYIPFESGTFSWSISVQFLFLFFLSISWPQLKRCVVEKEESTDVNRCIWRERILNVEQWEKKKANLIIFVVIVWCPV